MENAVLTFCNDFEFPEEAAAALSAAYDALLKEEVAFTKFNQYVELYFADKLEDYSEALAALDKAAGQCGIHRYTLHLLFYICLSKHMAEQYKKRNLPAAIYHDSIMDLKWALLECHKIHGIWGTFVADWVAGFFRLTRFALGRLQFELTRYDSRYTRYGHQLAPEDLVINVHIPSCGPLRHEDCLDSYQRAAEFFRDSFTGRPIVFVCYSWLLFPPNREILPETSNIIRFMADYDLTAVEENDGEDLWRIFNTEYNGNPDDLPNGTSLQRAYIRWLKVGKRPGAGRGVFFFGGIRMNHLEERVLMEAEKRKDELFAQLSKLIAVNTENFSTTGNEKNGQPWVAEMFEGLGLAADTFPPESLPGFSEHEAYFPGRHLEDRPDVCAVWPGREGRHRVMLAAHVDTVPIGDESQWTVPPLGGMIRDGRIWGRGASDDKAGIAVSWFAVHVLQACGVQLKDDVVLTSYSDEEGGGSHGALAAALKYPCNVYVNLDGGNMCLFTHGTGGGCFRIKFMKRMPTETALPVFKAVEAFCHALESFGQHRREELESNPVFAGSSTAAQAFRLFNVTVGGTGGTDLNIGSVDFAFYSLKSRKDAETELEALIEEIRPELDRLDVDAGEFIHTTRYFLPVMPDGIGPAAKLFAGCLEELRGVPTENQGMCLSDAPMFYHYGNGEVFSFCTGNRFGEYGGAHQPDEYVTCDNLLTVAKGVLLFLLRHSL